MTAKQTVRFVPCDPPIAATKNEDVLSHESAMRSTAANESQVKTEVNLNARMRLAACNGRRMKTEVANSCILVCKSSFERKAIHARELLSPSLTKPTSPILMLFWIR